MRSIDRYKQRYKTGAQSSEKTSDKTVEKVKADKIQKDTESFDFIVSEEPRKASKKFPIFRQENPSETPVERFERFNRQLGRAICACSLCPRGLKDHQCNNNIKDPHYQPSIWHKEIMLIKYEPDDSDSSGLFKKVSDSDDFYCTTVIKCAGEGKADCPFFKMELRALMPVMPKIIVVFDEISAKMFGAVFKSDDIQKFAKSKIICCHSENRTKTVFKLLSNPKTRSHLLS